MGVSLLLLKLLHCKQMNARSAGASTGEESAGEGSSRDEITIKKEATDDPICRVCLKEGSIPIYGSDTLDDLTESLSIFGGIDVREGDAYPKFLCQPCHTLLQGAILFRKTAQQSDQLLKDPPRVSPDAENDIPFDDTDNDNSYEYEETKVSKKQYHCKRCEISFKNFREYNKHRLSEEHENMRIVCPYCKKSYAAVYYKKHLVLHEQSSSPYICDICGKSFTMQGPFSRHRQTHFYKLPYKCTLCPYKGRFPESLKMHMRSHTGEKPYQCTECPSRFINKSNLNKHTLTQHKKEHAFKCDSCSRGFYSKRDLDLHLKVDHAGIKDQVCNICGKAFGYRKQMMKHQLKVHKREKMRSGRMPIYLKVESMKQQGQDVDSLEN